MKNLWLSLLLLASSQMSHSSSEGLDDDVLSNYLITGKSRPCCNFGPDWVLRATGIAGVIDSEFLGKHYFARAHKQADKVGIVYTCHGGFVDVSHLRDNADWAAHIYFNLPSWLGSNKEILARKEGGFIKRAVFFPTLKPEDMASLTSEDITKLTIAIGFDMALLHEIATSFNVAVGVPASIVITEKMSAFSIEDAYSNLLGSYLGVEAAQSPNPYNKTMTSILNEKIEDLKGQKYQNTWNAYNLIRNVWWKPGLAGGFKHVLKRNFTYDGQVSPALVKNAGFCSQTKAASLEIPEILSNGKSVNNYYQIKGYTNRRIRRGMRKIGLKENLIITQKKYPIIIEAIKKSFMHRLGTGIIEY